MSKMVSEFVHYIPKELTEGILYISLEYSTCAHLCPCGCEEKIRTPLGDTEWKIFEEKNGPTLYPSVGNWQKKCRSHYWIKDGKVIWAEQWSNEEILAGRANEETTRNEYYEQLYKEKMHPCRKLWLKLSKLIQAFFK